MINYRIEKVKDYRSCNFCTRGVLAKSKIALKFPYKKVFVIYGNHLEIRICKDCLNLIKKIN